MSVKLNEPLSFNHNSEAEPFLRRLQGNIIKGHGRAHTAHLFLQFETNQASAVRAWLRNLHFTDAWQQHQTARAFRESGSSGELFKAFFFRRRLSRARSVGRRLARHA